MKTGSLRARIAVVTLSLLALVLVLVIAAVTLAYRSSLERDLRHHLNAAGAAVQQAGSGSAAKPLVQGLALEGIATTIASAAIPLPPGKAAPGQVAPIKPGASIRTQGSLLILDEFLPDGTRVTFTASSSSVGHSVDRLLVVEVLVALVALALATLLVLLREQPRRPERDRIEAALARDAARLGRLIDDLLGLARLESRPAHDVLSLNSVIRTVVNEAAERAPNTKISLDLDDDVTIDGDTDSLTRLLRNLLDNALTAVAPAGQVTVSLHQTDTQIDTRIRDDGPGVPAAEREHIFERFVRLDPTTPGSGLGLAIARRIAHEHGGDLTCDPSTTGGSFTLHLPASKPHTA